MASGISPSTRVRDDPQNIRQSIRVLAPQILLVFYPVHALLRINAGQQTLYESEEVDEVSPEE